MHLCQVLHELAELFRARIGVQHLGAVAVRDETDVAVTIERLAHHRGGHRDGPLLGRVFAIAVMPAAIEVEVDPEVGGAVELELLDVKAPVPHRRWPVDPVHGIAWPVLADPHDHRGGLQRALPRKDVPFEQGSRESPERELDDPRVDEKERLRGDPRFGREEPEWVATPEHDRTEPEAAAPLGFRQHLPFAGLAPTDREHAAGERLRPVRLLEHLEPELPEGMIVRELVRELDGVAEVRIGLPEGSLHRKPLEREPRREAPRYTSGCDLVAVTTSTTYFFTDSARCISREADWARSSSSDEST